MFEASDEPNMTSYIIFAQLRSSAHLRMRAAGQRSAADDILSQPKSYSAILESYVSVNKNVGRHSQRNKAKTISRVKITILITRLKTIKRLRQRMYI